VRSKSLGAVTDGWPLRVFLNPKSLSSCPPSHRPLNLCGHLAGQGRLLGHGQRHNPPPGAGEARQPVGSRCPAPRRGANTTTVSHTYILDAASSFSGTPAITITVVLSGRQCRWYRTSCPLVCTNASLDRTQPQVRSDRTLDWIGTNDSLALYQQLIGSDRTLTPAPGRDRRAAPAQDTQHPHHLDGQRWSRFRRGEL
jgi:hypothetical protein